MSLLTTVTPREALALRDFQDQAVAASAAALDAGCARQLGVAATGLGKTVIFCAIARARGLPTLILAHRDELIEQAVDKVAWAWPEARVGVVKAGRDEWREDVVVASVQTISRQRRLDRIPPRFGTVVVDEAHHSTADSYRRVIDHFAPGAGLLLGVTATPDRGDGRGLSDVYERIVWSYDILWGIGAGWLSDLRGIRVGLDGLDLAGVQKRGGDFVDGALGAAMEAADAPAHVAQAWRRHAQGRRGIGFFPTIALASEAAEALKGAGIAAACVSGVEMDERRRLIAQLRAGALDVITNCAILTEGFDEPSIDCIVIARPTQSRPLYVQMIGRGTRRHPAKTDCLILDVVGATGQHELCSIPSLFGLKEAGAYPEDGSLTVAEAVGAAQERERKAGRLVAEEVDLFRRLRERRIPWVRAQGAYAASAGERTVVLERQDEAGERWRVRALAKGEAPVELAAGLTLERAQGEGENYVRAHRGGALADSKAPWRKRPPSPRQLAAAKRWRIKVHPDWTAGDLSEAIDAKAAEVRIREAVGR